MRALSSIREQQASTDGVRRPIASGSGTRWRAKSFLELSVRSCRSQSVSQAVQICFVAVFAMSIVGRVIPGCN
jgi:hypothetical protein